MNKFDERYEIRLARRSDIPTIMQFIHEHWRKDHIMATDRALFEYEYVDGDQVNFIVAIDRNSRLLEGIFGFINCSHTADPAKKDIWGSMWKVVDTRDNIPFLGVELARRVFTLTGCRTHIGNGANPKTTVPLRKMFFRDKTERMNHYYVLNDELSDYKIADVKERVPAPTTEHIVETNMVPFTTMEQLRKHFNVDLVDAIPYKDNWYVNKRYFQHPYYEYDVYGLQDETGKTGALMMTRTVRSQGRQVLRIVDYIGEHRLFAGLGRSLQHLLKEKQYEYIDFYTLGFPERYIVQAGFRLRTDDDPNIIPNYFEPFSRTNVDIWAHYKYDGTLFFKADGDQDRPNLIQQD